MIELGFDLKVEVDARASSTYTMRNVLDRLAYLKTLEATPEVDREIQFLQKLRFKSKR